MTTFNLAITYPAGEDTRIVAALRSYYTTTSTAIPPVITVPTQAQAIEAFRQSVLSSLRDIVFRTERDAAVTAAAAGVVLVNPT